MTELTCEVCGFVAKTAQGLKVHAANKHRPDAQGTQPEPVVEPLEGQTVEPRPPKRRKAKKAYQKLSVSHILEIIDTWERGSNTVETLSKKYNVSVGEIHRAIGMLRKAAIKPEEEATPAFLCPITLEEVVRAALAQRGMKLGE
ncbi:MAG: hypothetical protein HQK59_02700 [Deltaproteobacteria bacterium]|nr:hypothetical protein [Deltaproteobacteria bacterium]